MCECSEWMVISPNNTGSQHAAQSEAIYVLK